MANTTGQRPLWKQVVFQRLLNLPEPGYDAQKAKAAKAARRAGNAPEPVEPEAPSSAPANPWLAAASGGEAPSRTPITTASNVPWQIAEGSKSARAWRRIGRIAAAVVLALFAWVGFRTTFFPAPPASAPALPASVTFDSEAASGVASRFAIAALTWNEDDPTAHAQAVAMDYAQGESNLGWNRQGRQDVANAIPAGLDVAGDGQSAVATVLVQLVSYLRPADAEGWQAVATEWSTVEVPVSLAGGRMVATGAPSLTGAVQPADVELPARAEGDEELTTATRATAEAFFTAYGEGDVAAVEAPGASIVAPADRWVFGSLAAWQVNEGEGENRTATASVVWTVPDEPQTYAATYVVTLSTVTGGGADRWQISAITAGSTPSLN